jgi:nucleoside-diphosphate-sugar epimerase
MGTYLVTGGCGFIGSHIARALLGRGDSVRVLDDLSGGSLANLAGLELGGLGSGAPVEFVRASVTDAAACSAACAGVSAVFHEAAQVSVPRSIQDPIASYATNVSGTLQLLEAARKAQVGRFVFAASSAAYGNSPTLPKSETMPSDPVSPYASGKLAGEELLRVYGLLHGIRTVSLRYFNVFGPGQADDSPYTGVIALFARALLDGRRPRIYGDGEQTRDFTYVANVVEANMLAIERDLEPGIVINVGAGERISINAVYAEIARLLGSDLTPEYVPARDGDVRDSLAALDRARALLGYVPRIGWRQGLATTIDWYRRRLAG